MRFLTYEYKNEEHIGLLKNDEETVLGIDTLLQRMKGYDMTRFIQDVTQDELNILEKAREDEEIKGLPLKDVILKAPIVRPIHDIICLGVNYEDHLKESTLALKEVSLENRKKPVYFSKRAHRVLGHQEDVVGHFNLDETMDYEVELAVIIGKEGRDIKIEEVEDYIFGYSIFNDYSSRTLQKDHLQWFKGKSLDGYSVLGPYLVQKREISFPPRLTIKSYVNGELRQDSHTQNLIFDIASIISDLSRGMTLVPGDIIITGTPGGVGMGFNPPKYLKASDEVTCEIEGLGTLTNRIK